MWKGDPTSAGTAPSPGSSQSVDFEGADDADDRFDYEVAIDGDGRVRSVELQIEADDDGSGASLAGELSLEVRSFDQPVEVEPPSDGETVLLDDVPGLLEILQSGG
jgi:hypothetical protein